MKDEHKTKLRSAFRDAIASQIGSNRDHGWGKEDSSAIIDVLVTEDYDIAVAEGLNGKSYSLSPEAMSFVETVINPSQFRQVMEKEKRKDGQTWLKPSETKRQKRDKIFDEFNS